MLRSYTLTTPWPVAVVVVVAVHLEHRHHSVPVSLWSDFSTAAHCSLSIGSTTSPPRSRTGLWHVCPWKPRSQQESRTPGGFIHFHPPFSSNVFLSIGNLLFLLPCVPCQTTQAPPPSPRGAGAPLAPIIPSPRSPGHPSPLSPPLLLSLPTPASWLYIFFQSLSNSTSPLRFTIPGKTSSIFLVSQWKWSGQKQATMQCNGNIFQTEASPVQ